MSSSISITSLIFYLALLSLAWATVYPQAAIDFLVKLGRKVRQLAAQHYGRAAAKQLLPKFRAWGIKQGHAPDLVDDVLRELRPEVVRRLGTKIATKTLGKPHPLVGEPWKRHH